MTESLLIVLDNDRTAYEQCLWLAEQADLTAPGCAEVRAGDWSVDEARRFHLADEIKDSVERLIDDAGRGLTEPACLVVSSLCRHAFEQVDWHAVADHYIGKLQADYNAPQQA